MDAATLIKRARETAGLTQAELAKRARMMQPEIARLERRGANPKLSTLKRVVAAAGHSLKLDLDEDFGLDETLIVEELKRSPDDRLRAFEAFYGTAQGMAASARGS